MATMFKIGVDGGGSKTECILVDQSGAVVSSLLAPGCNPSIVGSEQARLVLTDALCALLAKATAANPEAQIEASLLCMAGSRPFWRELASTLADFGNVTAVDDSLPPLELATNGKPGLVVHAGTGSFVAARSPDGTVHYAGGLGWRFGDPGSGYDIGRRAIARALLEAQGWAPASRIGPTVRDSVQLDPTADANALTRFFYGHAEPNRVVAALAPAILRLAAEGDTNAHAIVTESAAELIALATKVAAKLFPNAPLDTIPAGLSGPLLTQPVVLAAIANLSPLALCPVDQPPIEGVRRLLIRI